MIISRVRILRTKWLEFRLLVQQWNEARREDKELFPKYL